MYHLTKLVLPVQGERDVEDFAECMSQLTGLRSLTLSGRDLSEFPREIEEQHLMPLTQLTHLSVKYCRLGRCRRFPRGIRSLDFLFFESPPTDFVETLMSVTNLTSLSINISPGGDLRPFHGHRVTPSRFSQDLGRLKHLLIRRVLADDLFFDAVGMLTRLTSLVFSDYTVCADIYLVCPRLSNLTELKALEISSGKATCIRNGELPQLRFPKLRKLNLPLSGTDANMQKRLWKILPCLRKLSLPGKVFDL